MLVREIFATEAMGSRILGNRWNGLREPDRDRVEEALSRAIRSYILPEFQGRAAMPSLRPADEEWRRRGDEVEARYWLVEPGSSEWFSFRLTRDDDGSCGVLDIHKGRRSLLGTLERRVDRALDDYSFAYMIAELGDYDAVVFDDFEDDALGALPHGWGWRDGDAEKNKPYRIQSENGNQYLEATDHGESVILGLDQRWDLREYPFVSFRVRVHKIPEGGDERTNSKVDSAAGLYFTLNETFFGTIPESVKYVWSPTQPIGTAVKRKGIGRPFQVVFGTGTEGLGEWRTYYFDVRQAYIDTWGGDPPERARGVGVLSDANSMRSQAYADYDDIRALRTAPPGVTSGVLNVVEPIEDEE